MALTPHDTPDRRAVMRYPRTDTRTAVRAGRIRDSTPPRRRSRLVSAAVRAASAPARARGRDVREGISLVVIQRQLGHADLAITSRYLRRIVPKRLSGRESSRGLDADDAIRLEIRDEQGRLRR